MIDRPRERGHERAKGQAGPLRDLHEGLHRARARSIAIGRSLKEYLILRLPRGSAECSARRLDAYFYVVLTNAPGEDAYPIAATTFVLMHKQPKFPDRSANRHRLCSLVIRKRKVPGRNAQLRCAATRLDPANRGVLAAMLGSVQNFGISHRQALTLRVILVVARIATPAPYASIPIAEGCDADNRAVFRCRYRAAISPTALCRAAGQVRGSDPRISRNPSNVRLWTACGRQRCECHPAYVPQFEGILIDRPRFVGDV